MNQKERLLELVISAPKTPVIHGGQRGGKTFQTVENIVDHLIANGVVVLPFTVGTNVCAKDKQWTGTVEEIAINSDGITLYIRSGGGGFYVRPDEVVGSR